MVQRLALPLLLCAACTAPDSHPEEYSAASTQLSSDTTKNAAGNAVTVSPTPIDLTAANPFFANFGTNGRVCGTCHVESFGWTLTPELAQSRPATDPLFLFDGSDCLPPGVPNPDPTTRSTQMLSKALIRVEIGITGGADYTLVGYTDPLGCPTAPSASSLRMYRRPLPAANTAFLSTVMWDGRENVNPPNNTVALIQQNLAHQSNDATRGHAQATMDLSAANQQAIVGFETNLFNAQRKLGNLNLNSAQADGGGNFLIKDTLPNFFIGINDVLGPNFSSVIFTIYAPWETNPPNTDAAAIGRGEHLFNTRTFAIDSVPGINGPDDALGIPSPLTGTCGVCHDSPNVGNHSTSLPIDIGLTAPSPPAVDVTKLPTYTFQQLGTRRTITVTDPGRGLISGKFKDLGKTKGPILRGLASRAPYFHNGSAKDLNTVIEFYDQRFHIGLTAREKADLVAFLQAL